MGEYNRGFIYNFGFRYKAAGRPIVTTTHKKGRQYMAGNPVPRDDDQMEIMAEKIAAGLHTLGGPLGILSTTEGMVRTAITGCQTSVTEAGVAKDEKQMAADALQATDRVAIEFLGSCRNVLANFLGNRWSSSWEPTGFPDESTAVPRSLDKRLSLCAQMQTYFTANPTREVIAMNVTAAQAGLVHTALKEHMKTLDEKLTAVDAKLKARAAAYRALGKILHSFINDLPKFLADDDGRWYTFGLNAPADPNTPEPVSSVALRVISPTEIMATWPSASRATRYRPFVQIVGVDDEAKARDSVNGLEVTLNGFHTGQTVKIFIVAANDDGEGTPGPTEQILIS